MRFKPYMIKRIVGPLNLLFKYKARVETELGV